MDYFDDIRAMELFSGYPLGVTGTNTDGDASGDSGPQIGQQNFLEGHEQGIYTGTTPVGTPYNETPPFLVVPTQPEQQPIYFVSTTFHSEFQWDERIPDMIIVTADQVLFHAHLDRLLTVSQNGFNGLIGDGQNQGHDDRREDRRGTTSSSPLVLTVPEDSILFNVFLHTIYSLSSDQYSPSLSVLLQSIDTLTTYGVPLVPFLSPQTPLHAQILHNLPIDPLSVYLTASSHDLESLAVAASAHLHSFPIPHITDEMAEKMGPVYLKRLVMLHVERVEMLKSLLVEPPEEHEETIECGFVQQKKLKRAWALAAAALVWSVRPDLSVAVIRSTFGVLEQETNCEMCKTSLNAKIRYIVLAWSTTRNTI